MKRTIIGAVLMITGAFIVIGIIIAASIYMPSINAWSGTKLWFTIFGAGGISSKAVSLCLGKYFVTGELLFIAGLVILAIEYFKKDKPKIETQKHNNIILKGDEEFAHRK